MANQREERLPLPAYISYNTLKGFIKRLKETAVPERVDRSVLRNYSNSVGSQLTSALRYLGLVNDMGTTTSQLRTLVDAYDTGDYQSALQRCLNESYRELLGDLNLEAATPAQLQERFKAWGASGDVLRKCITFFVAAAMDAGLAISPHITQRPRGKSAAWRGGKKRVSSRASKAPMETPEATESGLTSPDSTTIRFSLPIPGKAPALLLLPADVDSSDWEMINSMMKIFVSHRERVVKVIDVDAEVIGEG